MTQRASFPPGLDAPDCGVPYSLSAALLPRCMECRHGLAMIIMSVRPSVRSVHCDKTEERHV